MFEVVLAVLVIEIEDEGDGGDAEDLNFFGFAVDLQVLDELVFGGELVVELEMVDDPPFGVGPHLLVVVLVFVENPLEIGHSLACLDLLPDLPLQQHLPHQILVVVAPNDHKSGLILGSDHFQFLVLHFLTLIFLFATAHPRPSGQTGGIEAVGKVFLGFLLVIGHLFVGLLADFEVVQVEILVGLLLGDEQGDLLGVGWTDLLADEDVGEGLVIVEESAVGVDQKQIVVEFFGDVGRVFDFGEDVLEQRTLLGVGEDPPVLEEVNHALIFY